MKRRKEKIIVLFCCVLLFFSGGVLHSADSNNHTKTTEDLHRKLLRITEKGYLDDFLRYLKSIPPDRLQEIINKTDERSGENALLIAINELDPDRVYSLLQFGADPNYVYPAFADATPLLLLAAKDKEDKTKHLELKVLLILLKAGADTEAADSEKEWTALMHYARRRFEEAAEIMIRHDADIAYLNKKGEGPLTVFGRDKKSPILKMFRKYNALPGRQERIRMKKKMKADSKISLEDALKEKDMKKFLDGMTKIRDVNAPQNEKDQSPLILAVLSENPAAVEIVLDRKPDPFKQDKEGKDAFLYAREMFLDSDSSSFPPERKQNREKIWEMIRDARGGTRRAETLEEAVKQNQSEQVLSFFRKTSPREKKGLLRELLPLAAQYDSQKAFSELIRLGTPPDFSCACRLVEAGADVKYLDEVLKSNPTILTGKDPGTRVTLLMTAAENGRIHLLDYLISRQKASSLKRFLNEQDINGMTALAHAVRAAFKTTTRSSSALLTDSVRILLTHGASPDIRDKSGRTPLQNLQNARGERKKDLNRKDSNGDPGEDLTADLARLLKEASSQQK